MAAAETQAGFQTLRLPLGWTFGGLAAGLALGFALGQTGAAGGVLAVTETVGALWLHALQMTIILLVAALLVAVEMLPDIMRTLGNVTMDVAVTASVDQGRSKD